MVRMVSPFSVGSGFTVPAGSRAHVRDRAGEVDTVLSRVGDRLDSWRVHGGPTAIDVSAPREVASGVIAHDRSARWWQAGARDPSEAGPNAAVRASQAVFTATGFTVKWIQRPS